MVSIVEISIDYGGNSHHFNSQLFLFSFSLFKRFLDI